jgi:glycosyltransferase involved in cell wall biosynthesis
VTARSAVLDVDGSVQERVARPMPVRQLRVAQIVTQLTAGAGGITLRGAVAVDPERYSTTVLTAEGGSLIERAEATGLPVIRLRHMAPGRRVYPWADMQGLRELTMHLADGDFDLVHTHSSRAGVLGRMAARRVGVPAVVHSIHGFPFHEFQPAVLRSALVAIERRLAGITDYFLADGTVVAAEAIRRKIAPPERIRAIASPVDDIPATSEVARRQARGLLGIPEGARVVGTAARLDAQKSPLDMVKAIAALERPDVYMVWVGDGVMRAKTERLIARHGIGDRFLLLGDRMDVSMLLPGFDVFAMSSLYEGLPCALVEAMSCGVPVVATAVNSVPEIVISGKTGLLARPGDPASLSRALAHLLDHPVEAARMADAARAHIGDRFRPDVLGRDLMQAYEAAIRFGSARVDAARGRRG